MTDAVRPTVVSKNPLAFQTHGLGAKLLFDSAELSPYWGLVSVFEPDHDETLEPFDAVGETWEIAQSKYWEGQLAPPPGASVDGGMNEYQYRLEADDDWGDKDVTLQFRPGFPDAVNVHSGDPIGGIPDDCPESIRVQSISTNLEPHEVLDLLRAFAEHINLNPDYFAGLHEYSRAYQIERYARIDRTVAENHLTGAGGIIDQLADFASDQSGRGKYLWDHEDIQGHYQSVAFDPDTWSMFIPDQEFGKQWKCYHPKHVRHPKTDDPLVDPKVEVSLSSEYDPDGNVSWDAIDSVISDLDAAAYNVLSWADVPVQPDEATWNSEDPYFEVEPADEPVTLHANPLPDLREATERHVEAELVRTDITPTDQQLFEVLTDGGQQHYETLADRAETSTSAVYRLLDRLPSLLDSDNGIIGFADDVTRQKLSGIIEQVRETADWASDSLRRVVDRDAALSRSDDDEPSPLEQWMNRHGIELVDRSTELHFRLRQRVSRYRLKEILRAGISAAEGSAILTSEVEDALIDWTDLDGEQHANWQIVVDGEVLGPTGSGGALW